MRSPISQLAVRPRVLSRPDNQGCQMVEDWLQLNGWSKKRRVVVIRQRISKKIASTLGLFRAPISLPVTPQLPDLG